eukprot:jgi/Botrbrau1/4318/Bobra.0232s0010.1
MGNSVSDEFKDPTNTLALEAVKKKAGEALFYVRKAYESTGPPEGEGIRVQGGHQEIVDIWWVKERAQLVLAFDVPPEVLQREPDKAEQPKCLAGLRALKLKEGTVTVDPKITHVLDHFLDNKAKQKVEAILGKKTPRSILCTGRDVGGSLAGVASVLLAVRYPSAELRCITVDVPIRAYGNPAYAALYQHLVGFSYHLSTANLLYLYLPDQGGANLYGQWAQVTNLKPKRFDPTKANIRGWKEEEWKKLVITADPSTGSMFKQGTEAAPDHVEAAKVEKKDMNKVRMACEKARVVSPDVEKWLGELFSKDPSKELSLRWTDEVKTVPFEKLDTIEKMLLVGKRVAAMAGLAAAAYCDKEGFCRKTGLQGRHLHQPQWPWKRRWPGICGVPPGNQYPAVGLPRHCWVCGWLDGRAVCPQTGRFFGDHCGRCSSTWGLPFTAGGHVQRLDCCHRYLNRPPGSGCRATHICDGT